MNRRKQGKMNLCSRIGIYSTSFCDVKRLMKFGAWKIMCSNFNHWNSISHLTCRWTRLARSPSVYSFVYHSRTYTIINIERARATTLTLVLLSFTFFQVTSSQWAVSSPSMDVWYYPSICICHWRFIGAATCRRKPDWSSTQTCSPPNPMNCQVAAPHWASSIGFYRTLYMLSDHQWT